MLPKVITVSDFRKNIAKFLNMTDGKTLIIKGKSSNRVVIDEKEYEYVLALANQFTIEDPEGKYRPEFEDEILKRAKSTSFAKNVSGLKDLL
jgi:PHD/YefM family antitoxin component YafN of YafNO toxin-antitoxin module